MSKKLLDFPVKHSGKVHFEPEEELERRCGICAIILTEPVSDLQYTTDKGDRFELCPECKKKALLPREEHKRLLKEKIEQLQKTLDSMD